ncbi:MAG: hypothetical protein HYR64_08405, partial [Fimbriimonas ginsengisoli]|nr:hypothetical protein [Fimbriimonas ginsengisoli]
MKPYKLYLLTGASIGALVAPALFTRAEARRTPTPTSVVVVNGLAQPVPTAAQGTTTVGGTVNVGNTPSVSISGTPTVDVGNFPATTTVAGTVNVGNTPSVSISGTPTVDVGNSVPAVQSGTWNVGVNNLPAVQAVRGADNPALQPWQSGAMATLLDGHFFTDPFTVTTVPGGKRLVIQHVSAEGDLTPGQKWIRVLLLTHAGGMFQQHYFQMNLLGGAGGDEFSGFSEQVALYADAGTNVVAQATRSDTTG